MSLLAASTAFALSNLASAVHRLSSIVSLQLTHLAEDVLIARTSRPPNLSAKHRRIRRAGKPEALISRLCFGIGDFHQSRMARAMDLVQAKMSSEIDAIPDEAPSYNDTINLFPI